MLPILFSRTVLPRRRGRRRLSRFLLLAVCMATLSMAALHANAQAALHAQENMSPWTVGGGFSNFDVGANLGRMDGITAWVNWRVPVHTPILNRVGVEVEGREINFQKPSSLERMRQETGLGGLTLALPGYRCLHPYAKYLLGIGGIYFANGGYDHDTRKVLAPGGGVIIPLHRAWNLRADYEYQSWHHLFNEEYLHPNGITVGVTWNISHH